MTRLARIPGVVLGVAAASLLAGLAYGLDALGEDTAPAFILGCIAGALVGRVFQAVYRMRADGS